MKELLIYFIVQLILAIITTVKYVVTVKSSPTVAALVTTFAATIGGVGTKLLTAQPMWAIVAVLIVTNLAGVIIGRLVVDKFTKDRLWVYNATIKTDLATIEHIREDLKAKNIHSMYDTVVQDKMYILKVFAESKEASRVIKLLLNSTNNCKYHIIESR